MVTCLQYINQNNVSLIEIIIKVMIYLPTGTIIHIQLVMHRKTLINNKILEITNKHVLLTFNPISGGK